MCRLRWGLVVVFVLVGCVNNEVELFFFVFFSIVLDSLNMKCAMVLFGWLGIVGIILFLFLNLL